MDDIWKLTKLQCNVFLIRKLTSHKSTLFNTLIILSYFAFVSKMFISKDSLVLRSCNWGNIHQSKIHARDRSNIVNRNSWKPLFGMINMVRHANVMKLMLLTTRVNYIIYIMSLCGTTKKPASLLLFFVKWLFPMSYHTQL